MLLQVQRRLALSEQSISDGNSSTMVVSCIGSCRLFLLTSHNSFISFILENQRLEKGDELQDGVYFIESRNNRVTNESFGNCLVAVEIAGIWQLAITYSLEFKKNLAHLWVLRTGKGLDCSCSPSTTECTTRLCGFNDRFESKTVQLVSMNKLFPLNQLYSVPWIRSKPRDDVLSTTDQTYQCSVSNCDIFFLLGFKFLQWK